jgi:farnesol dehydrogenase
LPEGEDVRGDVTDAAGFAAAARGCDAVVHLAALVKTWVPERERFAETNVGGLRHALAAAEAARARLLYTSSFFALGPAGPEPADEARSHPGTRFSNDYERSKAEADAVAREAARAGRDIVTLYPGVIYGPGPLTDGNLVAKLLRDHMAGRLPGLIGPGDRLWSYSFVDDVAAGHALALERARPGERYVLAGENATLEQLFALVAELSGRPAPWLRIPYALASAIGFLAFLWAELSGKVPEFTHREVDVFRSHWAYSSAKAERDLGYERTPLREGVRRTLEFLREGALA